MDSAVRVVFDGERREVSKFGPSDLVAFERHFGVPASVLAPDENGESNARIEWFCFLIWRALRRTGVIGKDVAFDEDFLDRIEEIEAGDDDETVEDVPPTVPAPQAV